MTCLSRLEVIKQLKENSVDVCDDNIEEYFELVTGQSMN